MDKKEKYVMGLATIKITASISDIEGYLNSPTNHINVSHTN